MREQGVHNYPAMDRVIYGRPAAAMIVEEAGRLGAQRVMLMVSRTLNTTTGEIDAIRKELGTRYVATYDSMPQHTTRAACLDAAECARDASADLIVVIGGGSVIDAAKIVPMLVTHGIRDQDGFDPHVVGATDVVDSGFRDPAFRAIAVPSTLNAGEFNAGALITDDRRQLKQIFYHPKMMPVSVLLDPALTLHAPPELWFGSGMRAMDHGIEALSSKNGNPLVDEVTLAGIRHIHDGMLRTRADPADLEARRMSQVGAWMSAFGLQARVPMGASHGIGHVLGGTCGVPHYFCTPVMMPSVLRYNVPETAAAQARLAIALRGEPGADAATALETLVAKLGLPGSLREVSVGSDQFARIAAIAINHRFIKSNPRPIRSEEDIISILEMAA